MYKDQISKANKQYEGLESQTKHIMIETMSTEEELARLGAEVEELQRERPIRYIKRKEALISFIRRSYKNYCGRQNQKGDAPQIHVRSRKENMRTVS